MDVDIRQLTKKFEKRTVLQNVNVTIPSGQVAAIQGVSGSGKTTLLRLIAGFDVPEEGRISLGGDVVSEPGWRMPPSRRQVGFAFQTPALWPHMRVEENISYGLHGLSKSERAVQVKSIAHQLGIEELLHQFPAGLSGGEAQRVALARTLAAPFKLLMLDEPFAHLDKELAEKILPVILERCRQQQSTLIWVSHNPSIIENIVDVWVTISDSRVEVS